MHRLLAVAESGLALDLEYRRDGDAEPCLELGVGVDEALVEPARELAAERGLARARQADEKEIAPVQRHRGKLNGTGDGDRRRRRYRSPHGCYRVLDDRAA